MKDGKLTLSSDELEELGRKLSNQIRTVESSCEKLFNRWAIIEAFDRNEASSAAIDFELNDGGDFVIPVRYFEGEDTESAQVHAPLIGPITDSIGDNLSNIILGQTNYCTGELFGPMAEKSQEVTKEVQWHCSNARVDEKVMQVAKWVALLNMGVIRVRGKVSAREFLPESANPDIAVDGELSFAGVAFDAIHPRDFRAYPADSPDVQSCRMLAHRYRRMHQDEIKEMQDAGLYLKTDKILVDGTKDGQPAQEQAFSGVEPMREGQDVFADVWECLYKAKYGSDKHECWYSALLALDSEEVLQVERYDFAKPWYFTFYLRKEQGIYPSDSVGNKLQQLQLVANELVSQMVDVSIAGAYPMIVGKKGLGGLGEEQIDCWKPGKMVFTNGDPKLAINLLNLPGDLSGLMNVFEMIERLAEKTSGVSNNDLGTDFQGSMTATESAQIGQGTAVKKNALLNSFGNTFTEMWDFARYVLAVNYPLVQKVYQGSTPLGDDPDAQMILSSPVKWVVTGKNTAATPEQQFALIMGMLDKAVALAQAGIPVFNIEALAEAAADNCQIPGIKVLTTDEQRQQVTQSQGGAGAGEPGMDQGQGMGAVGAGPGPDAGIGVPAA